MKVLLKDGIKGRLFIVSAGNVFIRDHIDIEHSNSVEKVDFNCVLHIDTLCKDTVDIVLDAEAADLAISELTKFDFVDLTQYAETTFISPNVISAQVIWKLQREREGRVDNALQSNIFW